MKYLNEDDGPRFSEFQVQVSMRTIETCIHDPFGDVNVVPSGHGGVCGARCFVGEYSKSKDVGDSRDSKCKSINSKIAAIP